MSVIVDKNVYANRETRDALHDLDYQVARFVDGNQSRPKVYEYTRMVRINAPDTRYSRTVTHIGFYWKVRNPFYGDDKASVLQFAVISIEPSNDIGQIRRGAEEVPALLPRVLPPAHSVAEFQEAIRSHGYHNAGGLGKDFTIDGRTGQVYDGPFAFSYEPTGASNQADLKRE